MSAQRIDEIIQLLQDFVLGETNLSKRQVKAAIRLLDLAIPDARPSDDGAADDARSWPDDGDEAPVFADGRVVFPFSRA